MTREILRSQFTKARTELRGEDIACARSKFPVWDIYGGLDLIPRCVACKLYAKCTPRNKCVSAMNADKQLTVNPRLNPPELICKKEFYSVLIRRGAYSRGLISKFAIFLES